jgi:DsbC/DsbD-like thiol-disulfide interchange protein
MNRRHILGMSAALLINPRPAFAAQWQYRTLKGGFDGKTYQLGLEIKLDEGWKTYWRVPGDGGIPPSITIMGENVADVVIALPTPTRFRDDSGESIGYKHEVVFLIDVIPKDAAQPVNAMLEVFMGVCKEVCLPAQITETLILDDTAPDAGALNTWRQKIPQASGEAFPVLSLTANEDALTASLAAPVDEIFIETLDGQPLYFKQPQFTPGKREAVIAVAGAKSMDELKGRSLRVTSVTKTMALEQVLKVV